MELSSVFRTACLAQIPICALLTASALAADIGPGAGTAVTSAQGYRVRVHITPNNTRRWNDIDLQTTRSGHVVRLKTASVRFEMPAMSMGAPRFRLRAVRAGLYRYSGPAISMPGTWLLTFRITPQHGRAFTVVVRDHVGG